MIIIFFTVMRLFGNVPIFKQIITDAISLTCASILTLFTPHCCDVEISQENTARTLPILHLSYGKKSKHVLKLLKINLIWTFLHMQDCNHTVLRGGTESLSAGFDSLGFPQNSNTIHRDHHKNRL